MGRRTRYRLAVAGLCGIAALLVESAAISSPGEPLTHWAAVRATVGDAPPTRIRAIDGDSAETRRRQTTLIAPSRSDASLTVVDPSSSEIAHLASVDVKSSGVHIGGGLHLSANHSPLPGGASTAIAQRGLAGESRARRTTEYDFTLPPDPETWSRFLDSALIRTGFDISLHVGERLGGGGAYDGPFAPLLIAADGDDVSGRAILTGYPTAARSLTGGAGVLHQVEGVLKRGDFVSDEVDGAAGGFFRIRETEAVGGMSGGGAFVEMDVDRDGAPETYLIGVSSRVLRATAANGATYAETQVAAIAPHYGALAATIRSLAGPQAFTADDFGRITLLSGQKPGSNRTTVRGAFFHENIFGGPNADRLIGGGGDDALFGRRGDDILSGGDGADRFVFENRGGGDRVTDFSARAGDRLDLTAIDADRSPGAEGDQAFVYIGEGAFSETPGELRSEITMWGATRVEGDTNGDGAANFTLILDGAPQLRAADFVL